MITSKNQEKLLAELFSSPSLERNSTDLYAEFLQSKLASLLRQIQETDIELETRRSIHRQLTEEIDNQILSASIFIDQHSQ